MKPQPAQPDEAPALDAESSAVAWIAVTVALLMTVVTLLAAAFA